MLVAVTGSTSTGKNNNTFAYFQNENRCQGNVLHGNRIPYSVKLVLLFQYLHDTHHYFSFSSFASLFTVW